MRGRCESPAAASTFRARRSMRVGILATSVLLVGALLLLLGARTRFSTTRGSAINDAIAEIDAREIGAHLGFLAHDRLEGRAPATRGGELAAEYLAAQLSLMGYTPAGDEGTYFQRVPVLESTTQPASRLHVGDVELVLSSEVVAFSQQSARRIEIAADVVFVGHGIVAPEYGWNDYKDVDVTGKVVLAMVNEPRATSAEPDLFAGDALTYYGRWTYKFEEALRHGAAGAVLIHTDASATYSWQVVQASWEGPQYSVSLAPGQPALMLQAWVTDAAARRMVAMAGHDLDAMRNAAGRRDAVPVPLGVRLAGTLVRTVQPVFTPNVVGVLRGAETSGGVVLTAHYDHLGTRRVVGRETASSDSIFNGAIDNASGVAGALALARALVQAELTPRRSIYLLFTTAEESGLLGSTYFAGRLPSPPGEWAATVNIDELNLFGRTRDLVLIGAERSSIQEVATRVAARHRRGLGLDRNPGEGTFFRSDHFPFAKLGIPAVSVGLPTEFVGPDRVAAARRRDRFTNRDYHQPSDEVKPDWDYEAAADDVRLLADLLWTLANDAGMPAYRANDPFARPRD